MTRKQIEGMIKKYENITLTYGRFDYWDDMPFLETTNGEVISLNIHYHKNNSSCVASLQDNSKWGRKYRRQILQDVREWLIRHGRVK